MTTSDTNPFGIKGYEVDSYGEAFADIYDQWYFDLNDSDFVALIASQLPARAVRILELGVGTGRLISALLDKRASFSDHLVGVDSSSSMLEVAQSNLGAQVELVHADFSQTLPDGHFDLIFVGYNTLFNLPNETTLRSCLQLVHDRLTPTGRFFVDVIAPPRHDTSDHVGVKSMTSTEVVLSVSRHDLDEQHISGQFIQFTNGQPIRLRPWSIRYFSPAQLDRCAHDCGLELVQRTADGQGNAFTDDSERHISCYQRHGVG